MINRQALLSDLQTLLKRLEADLLERSESAEVPAVGQTLRAEYERAKAAERTALSWVDWREGEITQVAAAWVLSCVFVRFLEDNGLIDPPKLSGPLSGDGPSAEERGDRLQRARDERELYFGEHPTHTDRDYLLHVFDELAELPGTAELFGDQNPLRDLPNWLGPDAAGELLTFFQKRNEDELGALTHDFTDADWNTRFLGDLYQDLSEAARKRYALLQTPDFVEAFILDRTLEPALDEFGLRPGGQLSAVSDQEKKADSSSLTADRFRMIDPACGSGHFLLGAFDRLLDRWQRAEPGTNAGELVQRALDSVHGVDVNPYAVAIARFRLLLSAMKASGVRRLRDAPNFRIQVACGDSLYHGKSAPQQMLGEDWTDESHYFHSENAAELRRLLREGTYHCVVANPPYITPKDRAANLTYRRLYESCHMKYSLAVPFMERIFRLAAKGNGHGYPAGYTGQITANSFMRQEFGRKAIEQFFPKIDLTHVVDTSGAFIPGHGTPTVILFGRNQVPIVDTVRMVMGIRSEPATPDDPSQGVVWRAITDQIDRPGTESDFVSVDDADRQRLSSHPWSIGGGGATDLKELIEGNSTGMLEDIAEVGIAVVTLEDDAYVMANSSFERSGLPCIYRRGFVEGDTVRDWALSGVVDAICPHESDSFEPVADPRVLRHLWPLRTGLINRLWFRKNMLQRGMQWFEYGHISKDKLSTPLSIVYAAVATHNHFVIDNGTKVFKQSAPVIKLPAGTTQEAHSGLLGILNSSVVCFWLKQVCQMKGGGGIGRGIQDEAWEYRFDMKCTRAGEIPILDACNPNMVEAIWDAAAVLTSGSPNAVITRSQSAASLEAELNVAEAMSSDARARLIAQQDELDWECYLLYGLLNDDLTTDDPQPLELGQRAFEIVMARQMAAGELETTWFERHGSTPITELPDHWPDDYKRLVERRIELIETDKNLGLIERPEYKRRWSTEPWDQQVERACKNWLLDRLESYFDIDGRMAGVGSGQTAEGRDDGEPEVSAPGVNCKFGVEVVSVGRLADIARADERFQEVGAVYTSDQAFDVARLVAELVAGESVPLLPVLRYKPPGLRKRAAWEETWALQRREDAGEDVGDIPVPPKYASSDFISTGGARYWALRGKLDVPKERWVSFPHCEGADGTPVIAWAGLDHLQLAQAVSEYFVDVQERLGGRDDPRLVPLLGVHPRAAPLAQAVAQRAERRVRRPANGRLLRELRRRRSQEPRHDA